MDVTLDVQSQDSRYADFYSPLYEPVRLLRYDVIYRVRRMQEVLRDLEIPQQRARVLDVGFGWGDMLACFPPSCHIAGADISESAVARAQRDPELTKFDSHDFRAISGDDPEELPPGPFDIIVSSHTLEHVPDDRAFVASMVRRLAPGGVAVLFVPVEERPRLVPARRRRAPGARGRAQAGRDLLLAPNSNRPAGMKSDVRAIPRR